MLVARRELETVINKCPGHQPFRRGRCLLGMNMHGTRADRKPGEDTVGWPGLRAAGGLVAGETGWSRGDTAKAGRASGAAAFISGAISLATTQEDRLADGNINPSPSCLTSVP